MRYRDLLLGPSLFCLLSFTAQPALAFKGNEHRDLANLALDAALRQAETEMTEPEETLALLRKELLGHNRECRALAGEEGTSFTFGDITAAMDYVTHHSRFMPTFHDCKAGQGHQELCQSLLSHNYGRHMKLLQEELELVLARKCLRGTVQRLMAAHRNQAHFESGAQDAYNRYHQLALEVAASIANMPEADRTTLLRLVLLQEAIALHFLQDFMAPGHLLTRRDVHEDVASRWLHNVFNRRGLPASFALESEDRATLDLLCGSAPELLAKESWAGETCKESPIACLEGRKASVCTPRPEETCVFGDGKLGTEASAEQTRAVLALSARSIREVLAAARSGRVPSTFLTVCFQPWSARALVGSKIIEPSQEEAFPPRGFLGLGLPQGGGNCRSSAQGTILVAFPADKGGDETQLFARVCDSKAGQKEADGKTEPRKENFVHLLDGVSFSMAALWSEDDGSLSPTNIRREEADLLIGSSSRRGVFVRESGGTLKDCDFESLDPESGECSEKISNVKWDWLAMLYHVGGRRESWPDHRVQAIHVGTQLPLRTGKAHWNHYFRPSLALAEYKFNGHSTRKLDFGLRYGLGLGIVFAELGLDRVHVPTGNRSLDRRTSVSIGWRIQYPLTFKWLDGSAHVAREAIEKEPPAGEPPG